MLYHFGALLVFTGINKMWWAIGQEPDPEASLTLRYMRRHLRIAPHFDRERFFTTVMVPGVTMVVSL